LGYEVFAGNRVDVTTVEEVVETMERSFGVANRVWVMDRGMVSRENLSWLQRTGRRYLIGTPRRELKRWSREVAETRDWQVVRPGLEVKVCTGPEGKECFLLCRSQERREKELAMHERFSERIEAGLSSLGRRIDRSRQALDRSPIERQIGRLLERNRRAAARYRIDLVKDPSKPAGLRLEWSVNPPMADWARFTEGVYVLRTNILDWTPETLWQTYIQLSEAEAAFRIQKSDLSIRPIWHQRTERVEAHIFVCFLAYVLWKTLEQWQRRAGLGSSPRPILEELAHVQCTDVVLPLAEDPQREIRLRCVTRPSREQAALLDRLALRLPERLRLPLANAPM
jgi:transposase